MRTASEPGISQSAPLWNEWRGWRAWWAQAVGGRAGTCGWHARLARFRSPRILSFENRWDLLQRTEVLQMHGMGSDERCKKQAKRTGEKGGRKKGRLAPAK